MFLVLKKYVVILRRSYSKLKTIAYSMYLKVRYPWIDVHGGLISYGRFPFIHASLGAKITIGENAVLVNSTRNNFIGLYKNCSIVACGSGTIAVGDNVGCSGVSICAYNKIEIGNHVMIGANTMIFDTDFHSLNPIERRRGFKSGEDLWAISKPIRINDDVFIGANCIIGKGVSIGGKSIIAAGSVVVKSIPEGEVWGGNPARFIRKIDL